MQIPIHYIVLIMRTPQKVPLILGDPTSLPLGQVSILGLLDVVAEDLDSQPMCSFRVSSFKI